PADIDQIVATAAFDANHLRHALRLVGPEVHVEIGRPTVLARVEIERDGIAGNRLRPDRVCGLPPQDGQPVGDDGDLHRRARALTGGTGAKPAAALAERDFFSALDNDPVDVVNGRLPAGAGQESFVNDDSFAAPAQPVAVFDNYQPIALRPRRPR